MLVLLYYVKLEFFSKFYRLHVRDGCERRERRWWRYLASYWTGFSNWFNYFLYIFSKFLFRSWKVTWYMFNLQEISNELDTNVKKYLRGEGANLEVWYYWLRFLVRVDCLWYLFSSRLFISADFKRQKIEGSTCSQRRIIWKICESCCQSWEGNLVFYLTCHLSLNFLEFYFEKIRWKFLQDCMFMIYIFVKELYWACFLDKDNILKGVVGRNFFFLRWCNFVVLHCTRFYMFLNSYFFFSWAVKGNWWFN